MYQPPDPRNTLGFRLRKTRLRKRISQEQLFEATGISKQSIKQWEHQRGYPTDEEIAAIAKYLEVSEEFLIGPPELEEPAPDIVQQQKDTDLLAVFRKLSSSDQERIQKFADNLFQIQQLSVTVASEENMVVRGVEWGRRRRWPKGEYNIKCSFCGRTYDGEAKFISSDRGSVSTYICLACAELCGKVAKEQKEKDPPSEETEET